MFHLKKSNPDDPKMTDELFELLGYKVIEGSWRNGLSMFSTMFSAEYFTVKEVIDNITWTAYQRGEQDKMVEIKRALDIQL